MGINRIISSVKVGGKKKNEAAIVGVFTAAAAERLRGAAATSPLQNVG